MIRAGSSWCDVVKHADGRVEFVHLRGTTVVCEVVRADGSTVLRWARSKVGRSLLYLRAAADETGRICAIGQDHDDGNAWATIDGDESFNLGPTHGVFPVLIFGDSIGWVAFVQRTASTYDVVRIKAAGGQVTLATRSMPATSQGFLYVGSDGQPVTQDAGRNAIFGLALPSPAGDVWVGQSLTAATLALYDPDAGHIIPLNTPGGQPPHIVESGGTYFVCAYVDGGAWLRPFAAVTPPPVDPPPVHPPEEPPVSEDVRLVPNLIGVIEQTKRDYPTAWKNCHRPELSQAQSEEFARRAGYACSLVDPRFGLNGKRGDPNDLSDDCVCFLHDDGRESVIDFGGGAGGDNPTVQWSVVGHYQVPGPPRQLWIKAEPVGGAPSQPGTSQPPVTPPAARPFPSFRVPEDIFLSAYTTYIGGLYARDQIDEPGGWKVASRGATMWFVPIFYEKIIALISRKGNQLPTANEWWDLANEGAAAAIDFYRRTAPPE